VDVHGELRPRLKYVTVQPDQIVFHQGDTLDLTATNPWIADDTNPSLEQRNLSVKADHVVEAVNDDGSFLDLAHAHVHYSSSDEHVATVSPAGLVTAVGVGTATIGVTVDGVTGSTPIVVKQPFTLAAAPSVASAGSNVTATATLPNPGSRTLRNVSITLTAPSGWTVTATSPTSFDTVGPGGSAQATWTVAIPADAAPGSYDLTADATFRDASGDHTVSATEQLSVPYSSIAAAFDNPGISDDGNTTAGNLDGGGFSYSAQALAAQGLTPGATVVHDGLTFTWPNAQPGTPDNVVAQGQTVPIAGSGSTLGLLGTGDYGTASGTATITYTDGSTQEFALSFADWWANSATTGGNILASVPYINTPTGKQNQKVSVYYASVPLEAGKTVQYLTLPDVGPATQGDTAMHVFAIAVG
jgi:beta-glucosidase